MYRWLFKFAVTTLTILTANLLTSSIADWLVSYKLATNPLRFTLIAMALITIIFYPLFLKLEQWLNTFSQKFVKVGHSIAGRYFGLMLMFITGILILMYFYAKMWFNINIFRTIVDGQFFKLF